MNKKSKCNVNADAILKDYRAAYLAEHGKEPVMATDEESVRLDGIDYRMSDLPSMTEVLRKRAKSPEAKLAEDSHVFLN